MTTISPGDRVKQKYSGIQGRILRLDGPDHVIVDGPDGERRWKTSGLQLVVRARPPRGVQSVTDRMVAAVRMVEEGVDRLEVMRLHGLLRHELQEWIEKVREARQDAEHVAAIRRTG